LKKFGFIICLAVILSLSISKAEAATLSVILDKTIFRIGDTFTASVIIDSQDVGVNAAQGTITFSPDVLSVVSADKSKSVFDFWLSEPSVDNASGKVAFTGASIAGVSGKSLKVFDISFKVKGSGSSTIDITDAAVAASDGSGTNILSQTNSVNFTSVAAGSVSVIPPPQIARVPQVVKKVPAPPIVQISLYPDPNAWYNAVGPFLAQWTLPEDVSSVATSLDKNPSTDPVTSEGLFNNEGFAPLSDGIWYLHVRFKNNVGFSSSTNYRIAIDTVPPVAFTAIVREGLSTAVSAPTLSFESQDPFSGIEDYEIYADGTLAGKTASTTFILPALKPGNHAIVVNAVDAAGNKTESRLSINIIRPPFLVIYNFEVSDLLFFVIIFGLMAIGAGLGIWINRRARKSRLNQAFIARRDVEAAFGEINRDVEKALIICEKGDLSGQKFNEIKFTLNKISDTIKKVKDYISSEVEEINE